MTQAVSVSSLNPSGAPEVGADRALVASDQAAARLAPSGFDHGEMTEALDRLTVAFNEPWQVNNEDWIDVRANDLLVVLTAIFKARGEA